MERKAFADGELHKQHKELIAVGISVVINCESCRVLDYYRQQP